MEGGKAGEVWYEARLEQYQLRADYKAAETELARSGRTGGDAYGEGLEAGAKEGTAAVRAESKKAADATEKNLGGAATRVREGFTKAQQALAAIGVAVGIATVTTFLSGAINAASDLNEEASKTEVVFGDASAKVKEFASTADTALGQSERQALGAAGAFGNMFRTIGFADDAAADMSIRMVQLASDMGSFNNQDPSEMLERLRSGLSGEAEPLRQFGVLISEARVKAKAYEIGLAEAGAELTEQQKVVARYNLILQDTALQQGDFARTSDGLANSQRTLAAQWENTQARIGQALLPVATALVSLVSDVLPALADGFLTVFDVLGPFAGLLGDLAGLWADHADVLLPALIVMLGVRLVSAMSAAELKTKALTLAFNSLKAAALLGIPVALEGLQALSNEIGRGIVELEHGKEAADLWADAYTRMDPSFWDTPVKKLAELRMAAEEMGIGWEDLAARWIAANEATGINFEDFLARIESWADGSAAELQETARDWPTIVAAGTRATENAAAPLEGAIADPLMRGADSGVEAIDGMFQRIAERIAARENELREAGGNAVQAWLDPQVWANQADIIKSELKDANAELLTAQQEGTKAEIAEAKNRVLALTAEAIELQVNLATTGSSIEQQTKLSALATSDFMQQGLASRDPEIRALFRAWYETLVDTGQDMELEAGQRGGNVPLILEGGIKSGTPGVHGSIRNLSSVRPDTSWAYGSGYTIGSDFNAGLAYWIKGVGETSLRVGAAAAGGIKLDSPAKYGDLSEPAGNWSRKLIADFLAPIWGGGIADARAASLAVGAAVADGLRNGQLPGMAGGAAVAGQNGGVVTGGDTIHQYYLDFNGERRVVDSPWKAVEEAQRMGAFAS